MAEAQIAAEAERLLRAVLQEIEKVFLEEPMKSCDFDVKMAVKTVRELVSKLETLCKSLGGKLRVNVISPRPVPAVELLLACELPKPAQLSISISSSAGETKIRIGSPRGEKMSVSIPASTRPQIRISSETACPDFTLSADREFEWESIANVQSLSLYLRFLATTRSLAEISLSISGVKTKKLQVKT